MLALSALAVAPSVAVPMPPAVTPASRTAPIVEASCKIFDQQGRRYDLSIHQSGGQGYRALQRDGSPFFPRTPLKQDVIRDTAGIFDGFEFEMDSLQTWPGRAKATKRPGKTVQVEMNETANPGKFAVTIQKQWPMPFVDYLGFCDVTKTAQAPLSEAEAQERLKK